MNAKSSSFWIVPCSIFLQAFKKSEFGPLGLNPAVVMIHVIGTTDGSGNFTIPDSSTSITPLSVHAWYSSTRTQYGLNPSSVLESLPIYDTHERLSLLLILLELWPIGILSIGESSGLSAQSCCKDFRCLSHPIFDWSRFVAAQ